MRKNKKLAAAIGAVLALCLTAAGMIAMNANGADRKLAKQLELGQKYLDELEYEQSIVAFRAAIEIDSRCIEAYAGAIEAYLGAGDQEGVEEFYSEALDLLAGLNEKVIGKNMDCTVEIYLAAGVVYGADPEKVARILEDGLAQTGNREIKTQLIKEYQKAAKDKSIVDAFEEALIIYDRLLRLGAENTEIINDLCGCLDRYIDLLMESRQHDKVRELALRYTGADFAVVPERIRELEELEAKEDAALLDLLNSGDSRLKVLMECLAVSGSSDYTGKLNDLLQGTREGAEWMLESSIPMVIYRSPLWRMWEDLGWHTADSYCVITEEQAGDLIYAICGKRADFDCSRCSNWSAPYLKYMMADGEGGYAAENFSVERTGTDTWKVRAVTAKLLFCDDVRWPVLRGCFTVVRNPDSCFDGYSLTGYEKEEEAGTGWAKIYYDYLTMDPEGISLMKDQYGAGWSEGEYEWNLLYVDDDLIPELYLSGTYWAQGDMLLYLSDGKVACKNFTSGGGRYIPYTGVLWDYGAHMGDEWIYGYYLENGEMTERYYCGGTLVVPDPGDVLYRISGSEVTEEQFGETLNSYYEGLGDATIDILLRTTGASDDFKYSPMSAIHYIRELECLKDISQR